MTQSESTRRIMIAGTSGLIGRHLSAALLARDDEVLVLSRHPESAQTHLPGCAVLRWRPGSDGRWQDELDVVDAVVDLSGAPFLTKWHGDYYKREVLGSRRTAIQSLLKAIARAAVRPKVPASTSSLGLYGFRRDDQSLTERSAPDIGPLSRDALEIEARALQSRPLRSPIPRRALHLMFGKAAITITHGQRVLPARALELGHECRYPTLTGALGDLIGRGDLSEEPRLEAHVDHRRLAAR